MSHLDLYFSKENKYIMFIYLEDRSIHAPLGPVNSIAKYLNTPKKWALVGDFQPDAYLILPKEVFLSDVFFSDS